MKNVFYFKNINSIGGVETFFWYLSRSFKNMVIYYKEADPKQVARIAKNVEIRKYKEPIKCDQFFGCYGIDIEVDAPVKKHLVHCDYKQVSFRPITYPGYEYIGVSQLACDSFKELTGKECELIYNPLVIDKPKIDKYNDGKLHLISATRLTKEKGLKRMQKLARMLEQAGIDYEWLVYTNRHREAIGNKVIYKEPKLDIIEDIAKADFLVQLSDCEAFCYSVVEALSVGTPVICTNLPVFKELGVNKGNSIICDLSMSNVDINRVKQPFEFEYTILKSNWDRYLDNNSDYDPKELTKVKVLKTYFDVVTQQRHRRGELIEITKQRASYLEAKGICDYL